MTLTTSAWADGGQIPAKYTQAGDQVSPPLAWSNVPDNTAAFVLIVHDVDAAIGNGTDDILHWMLWNIPGATRSLAEGVQQSTQLADGTRQISASGPYYRGPGAPAAWSGASLRVRAVRARRPARRARGRRLAAADAGRRGGRDGRTRPRQGGLHRTVQTPLHLGSCPRNERHAPSRPASPARAPVPRAERAY